MKRRFTGWAIWRANNACCCSRNMRVCTWKRRASSTLRPARERYFCRSRRSELALCVDIKYTFLYYCNTLQIEYFMFILSVINWKLIALLSQVVQESNASLHSSRRELLYASVIDSVAHWELYFSKRWKSLSLELSAWLENKYINSAKAAQLENFIDVRMLFYKFPCLSPSRKVHFDFWVNNFVAFSGNKRLINQIIVLVHLCFSQHL